MLNEPDWHNVLDAYFGLHTSFHAFIHIRKRLKTFVRYICRVVHARPGSRGNKPLLCIWPVQYIPISLSNQSHARNKNWVCVYPWLVSSYLHFSNHPSPTKLSTRIGRPFQIHSRVPLQPGSHNNNNNNNNVYKSCICNSSYTRARAETRTFFFHFPSSFTSHCHVQTRQKFMWPTLLVNPCFTT